METDRTRSPGVPAGVVILCLATLLFGVADHGLWTPDEPREAEIARAMAEGSSWLVPRLAGQPFVEKPPLYYLFSSLMIRALRTLIGTTAAARAASALCGALALLAVWLMARAYLGRAAARAAAAVLATTVGFLHASHWILIDPLLMFLAAAAVFLLFAGCDRSRSLLLLGGYAAAALAFLTKGFVAWVVIAIPGLMILFFYRAEVRRRPLPHAAGTAILLATVLGWMAAFRAAGGPELWRAWFVDNQVGRFLGRTTQLGHLNPPYYYFLQAPLFLLPWTPALAGWIVHRGWRRRPSSLPARRLLRIAAAWAFGTVLLLSLSGTKRTIYLYPLLPAFALLIASYLESEPPWVRAAQGALAAVLVLGTLLVSAATLQWTGEHFRPAWKPNPAALVCAAAGVILFLRLNRSSLARTAAAAALFYLALVFAVVPELDRYKNYGPKIASLARAIPDGERDRVCGWQIDESTRAFFAYHCRLNIRDIEDRERLNRILAGEDPLYRLVVSRAERILPAADIGRCELLAQVKMGGHRNMLLIRARRPGPPGR